MSTFTGQAKHPKTGKKQIALYIDDFYGHHKYAIAFRKDGKDIEITDEVNDEGCEIYPIDKIRKES